MASVANPTVTEAEYFARDEDSKQKLEYVGGRIRMMGGGSLEHAAIIFNAGMTLGLLARARGCVGRSSEARVKIKEGGQYVYPDLSFACRKSQSEGHSLLNPTLVVEVLSPGTEQYDRGEKRNLYEAIPSLEEYLMVHSEEPWVECSRRHGTVWLYESVRGLDSQIEVLGGSVRLADLYVGIEFPR